MEAACSSIIYNEAMHLRQKSRRRQRKNSLRARGEDRSCISGASRCSLRANLRVKRTCSYESRARLESCSRDPIGFWGSMWLLYEYVSARPLNRLDPSGKSDIEPKLPHHCKNNPCTGSCIFGPVYVRIERIPGSKWWHDPLRKWRCVYKLTLFKKQCSAGCSCGFIGQFRYATPMHLLPGVLVCPPPILNEKGPCVP
jgi:hypothetical protein